MSPLYAGCSSEGMRLRALPFFTYKGVFHSDNTPWICVQLSANLEKPATIPNGAPVRRQVKRSEYRSEGTP